MSVTFPDDYMCFEFLAGRSHKVSLLDFGMEWPPPAELHYCGFPFVRTSMSTTTDAERKLRPDIIRGALYQGTPEPVLR